MTQPEPPKQPMRVLLRQYGYEEEYGPENNWRPGTWIRPAPFSFFFNAGGMGDYINYTSAILWLAQHVPWIHGTVYCDPFLTEFLDTVLAPYPHWKSGDGRKVTFEADLGIAGPELMIAGHNVSHQLCNATGAHLMDLGFQYYANRSVAPEGWHLPRLPETRPEKVHFRVRPHLGKYVVFTPGAIRPVGMTYGKHLNPLIEYVCSLGLMPVFLGKNEFVGAANSDLDPKFADDITYDRGIDLRNQTTVMQAAHIMEHAVCVLGLDNGLLHLAATTNATVIFGYNITSVADRKPRRDWGRDFAVSLTKTELPCIACQTNGKLMLNHTFHKCWYGDSKCVDMLFASGQFEQAIKEAYGALS